MSDPSVSRMSVEVPSVGFLGSGSVVGSHTRTTVLEPVEYSALVGLFELIDGLRNANRITVIRDHSTIGPSVEAVLLDKSGHFHISQTLISITYEEDLSLNTPYTWR